MNEKICVYAGSFDPPTNGHLWMIERGAKLFDKLVVAIGQNSDKKSLFRLEERLAMLRQITTKYPNVIVDSFGNDLLVSYAKQKAAGFILRGIRSVADYESERMLRNFNKDFAPDVEEVFLMPDKEVGDVSSSAVKMVIAPNGGLDLVRRYVPEPVFWRLEMIEMEKKFRKFWKEFSKHLTTTISAEQSDRLCESILASYREHWRSYHIITHIVRGLEELGPLLVPGSFYHPDRLQIIVAWLVHDLVYVPSRTDNEEQSYELGLKLFGFLGSVVDSLPRLVMGTKPGKTAIAADGKLINDVDLAVLGWSPARFDEYERQIRFEYDFVPYEEYAKRRANILEKYLMRETLYHTVEFQEKYEKQARANLNRSIAKLRIHKDIVMHDLGGIGALSPALLDERLRGYVDEFHTNPDATRERVMSILKELPCPLN